MHREYPLVSVVCLCYNHEQYVVEAMESVLNQTYENIELIVVDDASIDRSHQVINKFITNRPDIQYLHLSDNLGNCAAFNMGWHLATGKYVIDLAADDILLPERVSIGVNILEQHDDTYGMHFCDAFEIDMNGERIGKHLTREYFSDKVPEGYLFETVLSKYFINPVTMMYSNKMLNFLGGYDESLVYEDFDLWVRSSKSFKYCYTDKVLVAKRILAKSHGKKQYRPYSKLLKSTLKVCEKAFHLCETKAEYAALLIRINYEMKRAFFSFNLVVSFKFSQLKKKVRRKMATL